MVVQSEFRPERPQGQDANDKRQRLRQRFEVVKKLGQGTYGKVQLAINKETNGEVAIKTIKKAKIENEQDLVRIRREIQIMASIQHPHIIHIYEVFENSEKIVLVMQYASGGELYDYLGCHRKMPEKEARRVFRQIATAIYYCHKNKICHRDLKLENILLDDKGNAKIADFGLSNLFDERKKLRTFCGSPLYASPEIVKGTPYCGPEVDCWSLGVLLYTLVYGAMPFDGRNFKRLVKQISEGDYYEPSMKSKASGIIRRLLTVDVNCRATIKDICLDEWVNEGYDHSLLKLANDMADLTPVTVSSSTHAFPSAAANLKDLCIQNTETLTKNHHKNELSTYAKLKRNDFQTNKGVLSNSSSTDVFKIKSSPKQLAVSENAVPCEVKFVMGSILTTVEKMVQRSMLISSKQNTLNAKDDVANETNSPLRAADIKNVCEKKLIESNENDINNPVPNSDLKGSMINQNADKGIDLDITKEKCKPDENKEAANNADGVILRNEMSPTKNRGNRKEHIKTWNVNIDQTQLIPKEADSILPIFDVTSIIPKRPSRKSSKGLQEQLIQKEDDIKKTEKRAISGDPSKDEDLRICPKSHDENTPRAPQNSEINAAKSEKSETILSSLSKHRNDVIDYINNIFSRHKLSTQIIRHSELDTKENTSEMKSKQPKDICDSHSASQTTNENITEPTSNACPIKPTMEASTKNTENVSPTQNGEIGTVSYDTESPQGKMKISKAEKIAKVNQRQICQERDDPEREKQGESDGVNSSSPPHESKLTPVTPKEHKLCTDEVNSEVKRSSEDKNFENRKVSKIRKNSAQLISNSAENGIESISHPHKQRISLRDTVKTRNINGEDDKFQQGNAKRRLKNRSYSVGNNENINELEKILRRPRKYSLCALLAASFEFEQMAARQTRKDSDTLRKAPGKVEIPKSFDPSLEPDPQTPTDKRDFILIPSISVAENKQKMENEIEKVKLSALRMIRRKSEACSRRKMKKYTRSCTDILQRMEDINVDAFNLIQNCNQYELAQLNGSVDYLMDGNFKFGNELNFPIDHWSAENFDHSQPLPLQGNETYVPISRCCKKINFPPKPQQNDDKGLEAEENESEICTMSPYSEYSEGKDIDGNLEYNCNRNSTSKKLAKKKNTLQHSLNDKNKRESKSIQFEEGNAEEEDNKSIGQSESMYSSSVDKDSSDNDDDLDEIFGTKLDAQGSEDLWQFLKSVNTDISNHLKRIRYNKSLCSRSKSQECKTSVDHNAYEKLLTRSRSKEEKQNSQSIRPGPPESIGDSCYCSLASDFNHNSCAHMDKEQSDFSISMKNSQSLDEEFGSTEKDLQYDTHHQFSGSLKEKYYSLSNLEDPRTFLYPQNFQEGYKSKKCKSWATVPDLDDDAVFLQKNGDISPSTMRRLAIYNTMRPKQLQKGNRSQSQAMLNADKNVQTNGQETSSAISKHNINYTDKEHSISLRSKAQSDFNISSKELPYDLGSLNNLHNSDTSNRNSQRFCKSLGSRLNLESLNYSTDILSKKSHKTKENCHKKRERKVSFLDVSKSKNSNFGLESVAKAQKVLNSIDREVDTSPPEETGTLLEALKTQGYRTLISQRLQESEASEGPMNRRYSWACMRNIANTYPDSLSTLISEKGNMSLEDYTRYLLWNRNTFDTADDITYGNEILDDDAALYSDINMLNDMYVPKHYQNTESNWRVPPNMWLYQNLNNFRSVPNTSEEFVPHDWDNSVLFPTYNEGYEYDLPEFNSGIYLNAHQGKFNKKKHKASFEDDQHTPTFNEAGLQTNSPSTIEKLSIKIKALKNRCNQKSFDDLNNYKDQSSEPALSKEAEQRFSSPSDTNGTEDTSESVSDRIWRKSFYSRFNDVSTQRRRRSTFMESDFSADSFSTTLPKHHVNDEYSTDGSKIKRKEPISYSSTKGMDQKHVNGIDRSIDDDILLIKENDQHIPHPTTSKEQVDQIEDR